MFTTVQQRIDSFLRNQYPEAAVEQYEADKRSHVAESMLDPDAISETLNDMLCDSAQATLQTDALAFAIAYGRNDDRTIDAFNRLERAVKRKLGSE